MKTEVINGRLHTVDETGKATRIPLSMDEARAMKGSDEKKSSSETKPSGGNKPATQTKPGNDKPWRESPFDPSRWDSDEDGDNMEMEF